MTERVPFEFPMVDNHTPLIEDPFFKWLNENVKRMEPGHYIDLLKAYLAPIGWDVQKHTLTDGQIDVLKYVHEMWCRCTPYYDPCTWDELFTEGNDYTLMDRSGDPAFMWHGRVGITDKLKQMVESTGIYECEPEYYCFEIRHDGLHAVYQQILGGRYLCKFGGRKNEEATQGS